MNFVWHHELARRELDDDPHAALGATLPDLFRMVARRVRVRAPAEVDPRSAPEAAALERGIAHHLEVDRWFHRSEVFVAGERRLAGAFAALGAPRLSLFAHAAWEMCLDGALIRASGEAPVASLARSIGAARPSAHARARRATEAERGPGFEARLERLFDVVASGALPLGYAHPEGLVERLAGMRRGFGLAGPSDDERGAWERALGLALDEASAALEALLDDRARHRAAR